MFPFTFTNESITVIVDGKPHTAKAGTAQYNGLRDAIFNGDWSLVQKHLTPALSLQQWAGDKFVIEGDQISYEGFPLPQTIQQRIRATANEGKSPGPLFAFFERLAKNPSKRSVDQLYNFLQHNAIPIEEDGTFLAYKGVRADMLDCHSHTIDNSPGKVIRMPRNQVSDDPRADCAEGFHVGSRSYASTYGQTMLIVRVDPEYAVSVPYDGSGQKMRVCEYTVVGFDGGRPMPSTTVTNTEVDVDDDDDVNDDRSDIVNQKPYNEEDAAPCKLCGEIVSKREYTCGGKKCDAVICDKCDRTGVSGHNHVAEDHHENNSTDPSEDDIDVDEDDDVEAEERRTEGRVRKARKKVKPNFKRLEKLGPKDMMDESIDQLRAYAGKKLKIVGATKLPGGKSALVSAIFKARKRRR